MFTSMSGNEHVEFFKKVDGRWSNSTTISVARDLKNVLIEVFSCRVVVLLDTVSIPTVFVLAFGVI